MHGHLRVSACIFEKGTHPCRLVTVHPGLRFQSQLFENKQNPELAVGSLQHRRQSSNTWRSLFATFSPIADGGLGMVWNSRRCLEKPQPVDGFTGETGLAGPQGVPVLCTPPAPRWPSAGLKAVTCAADRRQPFSSPHNTESTCRGSSTCGPPANQPAAAPPGVANAHLDSACWELAGAACRYVLTFILRQDLIKHS